MQKGITVYPGLDNCLEENLSLMENAAKHGFSRLILALLLPYANRRQAKADLSLLLKKARQLGLEVIAALTPEVMEVLHISHLQFSAFQFLGINTLYLHDFAIEDIAELSRNPHHICIQFNASRLTPQDIQKLIREKPNLAQLDALHNCYPRAGSGMSEENLIRKTVLLHRAGISVGAFLPSQGRKRGPFHEGLPSLEMHRHLSADLAGRHYAAIGMDSIFLGDSLPTEQEISDLSSLTPREILLRAKCCTSQPAAKALLRHRYTAHFDEARDAVRAIEGMRYLRESQEPILPEHTIERHIGDVTIDNIDCPGYMGELQIIKRSSPASPRTNVAASILEEEAFLINYIMPGRKFRLLVSELPKA